MHIIGNAFCTQLKSYNVPTNSLKRNKITSSSINSTKLRSETVTKSALPVSQLEFLVCFETHFPIELLELPVNAVALHNNPMKDLNYKVTVERQKGNKKKTFPLTVKYRNCKYNNGV